ncbi:hypothetical protein NHQ30_008386 [Ciborinia camelliae]|nr:hypothetical protein NHQ30_008386 [Ciborinia camelliae]
MSLNGGRSVLNRWKKNRTQSGISTNSAPAGTTGTTRPTTSGGLNSWTEYTPSSEEPFQKAVEEAVLNAINSDAFRNVIGCHIDPVTATLSRQQEKLNALKISTLNLESSFSSANIKSTLDPALKPISQLIDDVPDTEDEIESLVEGQKKILEILKSLDERLNGLDSKFEEFEEKITSLDGEIVNADLRSAIRFGELSNELQDRNKMLGERLWSVEGDLGKKIDGSHRKLVGMVEDLGKSSRNVINKVSSMEFDSSSSNSSKLDEMLNENSQMVDRMESLKKSVTKLEESQKNIQSTEKGLARNIQEVRDIVSSLNTSSLENHSKRLDDIERSIITVRKELENQRQLASVDSDSVRGTIDRVEQHVKTLNTSQFDAHRDKLTMIASMMTSFAESMADIQDGVSKTTLALLPNNEVPKFDDLASRLSDMRAELDARLEAQSNSLEDIHKQTLPVDVKKLDEIATLLNSFQSGSYTESLATLLTSEIKTSEEAVTSAIQSLQTATSELSSDIKNIDFGPTNTSIDALTRDVQSTYKTSVETAGNLAALPEAFTNIRSHVSSENVSMNMSIDSLSKFVASIDEAIKETGRDVQGNTEILTNIKSSIATSTDDIRFLLDKQVPLIRQDIQAIDLSELESAATKNQASVDSIEKAVPQIIKTANDHASALSQLDYKMKYLIGGDIAKIGKAIEAVAEALSQAALETISAVEGNAARLQNIRETVLDTYTTVDTLTRTDIPGISYSLSSLQTFQRESNSQALEKLQINDNATGSIRDAIEHISAKINDLTSLLSNIKSDLNSSAEINSSTIHALSSNILNLDSSVGQTTTAVRINGAALARIDKGVLETGAQVKSVVLEGNKRLIKELDRAVSQLDELSHDNGTRIRGISDYVFPKIEAEMRGIHTTLERLTHNNIDGLRRTRDSLAVIGTKIVGTSRKFDDLVDAVHSSDDLDHLTHSKTLVGGNGKIPGEHRILGTRRSRGGSNASSTKDGPALSGLRLQAFTQGHSNFS